MKTKNYFVIAAIFFQIATGLMHGLSFFVEEKAANETEKKILEAVSIKMDLGAGFQRSYQELFLSLSVCMTLLCIVSGAINWMLYKKKVEASAIKGVMLINTIAFGIALIVMLRFAFLPPIVCMGLIFTSCAAAWATTKK